NKWNALNIAMREEKIGIIALQETHLDDGWVEQLHRLYGRRMKIINSAATRATAAQGVAFVLNRELTDIGNVSTYVLIPGRAMIIRTKWHLDKYMTILNVYAPNDQNENAAFWRDIATHFETSNTPRPDIILGDFNVVEEAIDRIPMREDQGPAVLALRDLTRYLNVEDGWRITMPTEKQFSFPQRGAASQSRLDRIYATPALVQSSVNWSIKTTGIPTDHKLVSAQLSSDNAPFIGRGRWTMPLNIIQDQEFIKDIVKMGIRMNHGDPPLPDDHRPLPANAQSLLKRFKEDVVSAARARLKKKVPKMTAAIRSTEEKIRDLLQSADPDADAGLQTELSSLQDKLSNLQRKRYACTKEASSARYALNAERPSKYWSNINKERKPRDVMYSLKVPESNPPRYEKRSDRMATIARNYHEALQSQSSSEDPTDTEAARNEALRALTTKLTNDQKQAGHIGISLYEIPVVSTKVSYINSCTYQGLFSYMSCRSLMYERGAVGRYLL
ncbi:Endonuclease/exonuclease/phosphatase, partial [Fomitopsis serialis]|uniref:Endonuclease/exonuclease/phosphatase n=1 Tax=Fomitopsis serialis TaxID=139415 RepID=UPI0020078108